MIDSKLGARLIDRPWACVSEIRTDDKRRTRNVISFNRSLVLFYGLSAYYVYYVFENIFVRSIMVRTSFMDELVIVFLVALAALSGLPKRAPGAGFKWALAGAGLFVAASVLSTIFSDIQGFPRFAAMRSGLMIDMKPFLAVFAIYLLLQPSREWRGIRVLFAVLTGIALINSAFVVRDIAVGGANIHGHPLMMRAGVPLATGLFHHKVESVQMTLLGLAGCLGLIFYRPHPRRWLAPLSLAALWLGLIALAHLSVKEIFAIALIAVLAPYAIPNIRVGVKLMGVGVALLIGALAIAFGPQTIVETIADRIETFVDGSKSEETIRERSYTAAVEIAGDYFPLGTGAGTYLSAPSRFPVFSPVYHKYGLSKIDGGSPDNPIYLLDTFWPKILGEAGWIGFIGYLVFYGALLAAAVRWWLADQGGVGLAAVVVLSAAL
ncbi:MAG: hypothetical protein AAGL49_08710, partial [Pseudomonadota bacterium]